MRLLHHWPILVKLLFAFGAVFAVCTVVTSIVLWQLYTLMQQLDVTRDAVTLFAMREQLVFGVAKSFWVAIGSLSIGGVGIVIASFFIRSAVVRPIAYARDVALRIAAHDLRGDINADGRDEIGALLSALASMQDSLRSTLNQVKQASEVIKSSTSELAEGSSNLSARTEQTAANLEETSATIVTLTQAVRANAQASDEGRNVAHSASQCVQQGDESVHRVVATMGDIHSASRKIAEIIGVIDGIAFQTNILALNAAVEAARAGEQGRGFAVVASEVRSLAGRSSQAAKEIRELISSSVQQVEMGSEQVHEAGQRMKEILTSVHRVADIVSTIHASTKEQSQSIAELGQSVDHVDQMTQQNAALVEESAAATASMRDQAYRLTDVVGAFSL